jgi:hypothetical protein
MEGIWQLRKSGTERKRPLYVLFRFLTSDPGQVKTATPSVDSAQETFMSDAADREPLLIWWQDRGQDAEEARVANARQKRRTAAALVGAAVVILSLGMLSRWLGRVRYPDKWDPKVAAIAADVERLRGLKFKRPVYVRSVPEEKFDAGDDASDTKWRSTDDLDSKKVTFICSRRPDFQRPPCQQLNTGFEIDPVASTLRAMHVTDVKSVVSGLPMDIQNSVVVARYDADRKRVEVRGSVEGVPKSVIAHELTHVLQDQHFGFNCECLTLDESLGFRSLVEGDASRIEMLYSAKRPPDKADLDATEALDEQVSTRVNETMEEESLDPKSANLQLELAVFPYFEGQSFVEKLFESGGQKAVDAAFAKPPRSAAEILRQKTLPRRTTLEKPYQDELAYNKRSIPIGVWYWRESLRNAGLGSSIDDVIASWTDEAAIVHSDYQGKVVCFTSRIALSGPKAEKAADAYKELADQFSRGLFRNDLDEPVPSITIGGCDPKGFPA